MRITSREAETDAEGSDHNREMPGFCRRSRPRSSPRKQWTVPKRASLSALSPLHLVLLVLWMYGPYKAQAAYGVCYDDMMEEYLACTPGQREVISTTPVTVTVEPESGTCGTPRSLYRLMGDRTLEDRYCDATNAEEQHPPSDMVDSSRTSWWQSINSSPNEELHINVTLSFDKRYRMAGDMLLTWAAGRPERMVVEKSDDYGQTWTPFQYFARNCQDFADVMDPAATITKENPTAVICTNEYVETSSRAVPGRRVFIKNTDRFIPFLGPNLVDFEAFYTALENQNMLDFLTFTDLRFQLLRPANDGRNNYEMYYYAISHIQVVARCFCNNHAAHCNFTDTDVVCDCEHFTTGKDCERCLPLYNERPWQRGSFVPYDKGQANVCVKCECNEHADSCTYNATYGRGICDVCQHNTEGNHCEKCTAMFYPDLSLPLSDINRCLACDCEALGVSESDFECTQTRTPTVQVGQCTCKTLVTGRQCDSCTGGYWGLKTGPTPGTCTACGCNLDGTAGQSNTCDQDTGQCPCKTSVNGTLCDVCADGYYAFPTGNPQRECLSCNCDKGGSISPTCNKVTGVCDCRAGVTGDKCDRTIDGRYVPALDDLTLEPTTGPCTLTSGLYTTEAPFDGRQMAQCDLGGGTLTLPLAPIPGGMVQMALEWPYYLAVRYTTNATDISGTLTVTPNGNTAADLAPLRARLGQEVTATCPAGSVAEQLSVTFTEEKSHAVLTTPGNVTLDARCQYSLSLQMTPGVSGPNTRRRRAIGDGPFITIDSVVPLPALSSEDGSVQFNVLADAEDPSKVTSQYKECLQQLASLTTRPLALRSAPCNDILFSVGSELYNGALDCSCSSVGTAGSDAVSNICQDLGGQCSCLPGVSSRTCAQCTAGYFNLTEAGCEPCSCSSQGSTTGACDYNTGQCPCRANIVLASNAGTGTVTAGIPSSTGEPILIDGTCSFCMPNFYGITGGQGCRECGCNSQGSTSLQCDESGQCPCKDSVQGLKCDVCKDGFYGFGAEGCTACNCSTAGSLSLNCDQADGTCDCKTNAQGDKCADCKTGFFNLADYNPDGCQPCFCYNHGTTCDSAAGFEMITIEVTNPNTPDDFAPLLGDRHTSYSQMVKIGLTAGFTPDITGSVILSLTGNGKTVQHRARNSTKLLQRSTTMYETRLLWREWETVASDGSTSPATAKDVLEVLASLEEVKPIARFTGQAITTVVLSLTSAQLTVAPTSPDEEVTFVEQCACNPVSNVAGLSCESCSTGFRRPDAIDVTSYETCVACNCNGRGATTPPECNELSGVCLNCRNGTTGDQCELCSNHVTGPECDTCEDEYWGLDEDGCRACNCSDPGSTSPICDKGDGQCVCADHVTSRTCSECEENFHDLTATGCVECDACYGVVGTEIAPLRTQTASLETETSRLQASDYTLTLGPFTQRLQEATSNTDALVTFLESAQASESEILAQIASFSASLDSVETGLRELETNTTVDIRVALNNVNSLLLTAQAYRTLMENGVKPAHTKIASLVTESNRLTSLVSSLQSVENRLVSLAESNSADQAILDQLSSLNSTVATAAGLADTVLQNAQAAVTVHQTTNLGLLALESRLLSLTNQAAGTLADAKALASRSTDTKTTRQRLDSVLAELRTFSVNYGTMDARLRAAQAATSSRRTEISGESAIFSPTNLEALATVEKVEDLSKQTTAIAEQAVHWLTRSTAAEKQALTFQSEANKFLKETQSTLDVVTNFDVKVADVQQRATKALEQVAELTQLSQQVMNETLTLTETLVTLGETASQARQASQQALQIIGEKQQQLSSVTVTNEELSIRLATLSDGSIQRRAAVNEATDNIVTPAQETCANLNSDISSFQVTLLTTETNLTETLLATSGVTQRANALLGKMRTLASVDGAREVIARVQQEEAGLNMEALRATLLELQGKQAAQGEEISRLTGLKDTLKTRLNNLKILRDQIIN